MNERPRFLANLADEDRAMQTPRRVEAAIRQRVAAVRKPSPWRFLWPVVLTTVAAIGWLRPQAQAPPPMVEIARVVEPMRAVPELVLPAKAIAPRIAKALPRVTAPVQERITRRFYELAYAPPELLANSRMMRVRVPRAALLSFGLPLSAYRAQDEKVAADVIYTEDGIARAIRFVEDQNQE